MGKTGVITSIIVLQLCLSLAVAMRQQSPFSKREISWKPHYIGESKYSHLIDKSVNVNLDQTRSWGQSLRYALLGENEVEQKLLAKARQFTTGNKHHLKQWSLYGGDDEEVEEEIKEVEASECGQPGQQNCTNSTNSTNSTGNYTGNTMVTLIPDKTILMYIGPMQFGKAHTELMLVFDTGSDWLVVESTDCYNCEGDGFDLTQSSTKLTDRMTERHYGSASLQGYEYRDKVCLDMANCVFDFEFFAITRQTGISEPIDGILGLSLNYQPIISSQYLDVGPLYIDWMFKEEMIEKRMFSFYASGLDSPDSHFEVGLPQTSMMKNGNEKAMYTLPVNKDFFWSSFLQGIAFGDFDDKSEYRISANNKLGEHAYTVLDTGSSAMFIPAAFYQPIINQAISNAGNPDYIVQQGLTLTTCSAEWQPIWFMFEEHWIQLDPADYLLDVSENGDGSTCLFMMMAFNMEFFLMGMPMYQGYYTVHDMDEPSIGFVPHAKSTKMPIQTGVVPENGLPGINATAWIEIVSIIYFLAVYGVWYFNVEPYLLTTYGEKTFKYVAYGLVWSVFTTVFFYLFLVPVLNVILY